MPSKPGAVRVGPLAPAWTMRLTLKNKSQYLSLYGSTFQPFSLYCVHICVGVGSFWAMQEKKWDSGLTHDHVTDVRRISTVCGVSILVESIGWDSFLDPEDIEFHRLSSRPEYILLAPREDPSVPHIIVCNIHVMDSPLTLLRYSVLHRLGPHALDGVREREREFCRSQDF